MLKQASSYNIILPEIVLPARYN